MIDRHTPIALLALASSLQLGPLHSHLLWLFPRLFPAVFSVGYPGLASCVKTQHFTSPWKLLVLVFILWLVCSSAMLVCTCIGHSWESNIVKEMNFIRKSSLPAFMHVMQHHTLYSSGETWYTAVAWPLRSHVWLCVRPPRIVFSPNPTALLVLHFTNSHH